MLCQSTTNEIKYRNKLNNKNTVNNLEEDNERCDIVPAYIYSVAKRHAIA